MKILIFGLPGSGKTTLATPLARQLGAVHINADEVRTKYDDWDFSPEGRMRQANRMKHLSDGVVMAGKIAVTDFVCPPEAARKAFNPPETIYFNRSSTAALSSINSSVEIFIFAIAKSDKAISLTISTLPS